MRTFQLIVGASIAALIGAASIGSAIADTYDFSDFSNLVNGNSVAGPNNTFQPGNGADTGNVGNVDTFFSQNANLTAVTGNASTTVQAEAFYTTAKNFSGTLGLNTNNASVNLTSAFLGDYTSSPNPPSQQFGLGVTDSSETGTSPTHTVSNETGTKTDIVAFLLPSSLTQPTSILINQFCANGSGVSGSATCTSIGSTGHSNMSVFIGNASSLANLATGSLKGFTQLTDANLSSGSLSGTTSRTITINPNSGITGNILIVTASLSDLGSTSDYFKIGAISASAPPVHNVPEPGTLAIFGVGLAGLVVARRQRRKAA